MDVAQVGQWLWGLLGPMVEEAVTLAAMIGLFWLRARYQQYAAVQATAAAETDSINRQRMGLSALPGDVKKKLAIDELTKNLPLLAKPLSLLGGSKAKLVEKHFRKGKDVAKKASIPPHNQD